MDKLGRWCEPHSNTIDGMVPTRVGVNRRNGMPRKIRQLIADVKRAGMVLQPERGKGSHRIVKQLESGTQATISRAYWG